MSDHDYNVRLQATSGVVDAMTVLLSDMGLISAETDPALVLEGEHAKGIFDAFIRTSRFEISDVIPRDPDFNEPGYPERIPVIWNMDAARDLRRLLIKARQAKSSLDESGEVAGFSRSIEVFFRGAINGDPADTMIAGARGMIPLALNWDDVAGAGSFGDYLRLPRDVVTHHTRQQAHAAQIAQAIASLSTSDIDENTIQRLRAAMTLMNGYVLDLGRYFFEQYSLAGLHTERVQNGLFSANRDHRVWVARVALNVSQMNDIDPTGKLADFILNVMDEWLEQRRFVVSHAQSAEKTTFQIIVERPEDLREIFRDFEMNFKSAMLESFSRRHKDIEHLSEDAQILFEGIHRFSVRATAVVLPFDHTNVLSFAIQNAEDVKTFYEIIKQTGIPSETLEAALKAFDEGKSLDDIRSWFGP